MSTDSSSTASEPVSAVTTRTSEHFSAEDSDVTFQSSDGVLFLIHRVNLDTNTAGFPPPGFDIHDEVVHLTEHSEILELLFQFIYPRRHPDLASTAIAVLPLLCEAAEKYEVFPAMNICTIRMKNLVSVHPYEVMLWAVRHDHPDTIGEAAPLLLDKPLNEMVLKLTPNIAIAWVLYYESWRDIFSNALLEPSWVTLGRAMHAMTFQDDRGQSVSLAPFLCTSCNVNLDIVFSQFVRGLKSLKGLPDVNTLGDNIRCCVHVRPHIQAWLLSIKQQVLNIPTFD